MARFVPVDRDTQFLFPPSVQEWLPKDHLARFVVDVVEQLDLSGLEQSYAGRAAMRTTRGCWWRSCSMAMPPVLLQPGLGTGELRLDRLSLHHGEHPSGSRHDQQFPQAFLMQIEAIFVQVLGYAREMGMLKLGT